MSINKEILVKGDNAAIEAHKLQLEERDELEVHNDQELPAIDKTSGSTSNHVNEADGAAEKGDYEGRKYQSDIDGPEQASQETDEVYADPRDTAGLPPAGKNVGDLNANDLSRQHNDSDR